MVAVVVVVVAVLLRFDAGATRIRLFINKI